MRVTINTNKWTLDERDQEKLDQLVDKTERLLPNYQDDIVHLNVVIHAHTVSHTPKTPQPRPDNSVEEETKPAPKSLLSQYETTLTLMLPSNQLHATSVGDSVQEASSHAFQLLLRQIKEYKATHFSSHSDFPRGKEV